MYAAWAKCLMYSLSEGVPEMNVFTEGEGDRQTDRLNLGFMNARKMLIYWTFIYKEFLLQFYTQLT